MRVESGGQANVTAKLRVTNMDWNDIRPAFPTPIANLTDEEIVYSRNRGLNFFDYYMVHAMNGIVAGQRALWISRRSPHKAIDPDMWDNLVAGGMPAGSDPLETLVRECDEESGIPPDLARRVEAHGVIDVLREISEGVQWERVYVYDLVLPADFVPHNRDGEVAEHRRIDPEALLAIMADRAMTVDATLVTLDALRRRSWVAVQP